MEPVISAEMALGRGFYTFTAFTLFFDGTKRRFDCKNWLVVTAWGTRLPVFMVSFASFAVFFDGARWLIACKYLFVNVRGTTCGFIIAQLFYFASRIGGEKPYLITRIFVKARDRFLRCEVISCPAY